MIGGHTERREPAIVERPETSTSDPYVTPGAANTWSAEAAGRGRTGTQRLLYVNVVEPTPVVREALALDQGENVVVRSRLIFLDDQPIEIASSYYPASIAFDTPLAAVAKIRGGAIAVLAELGHAPAEVAEHVTARWPDEEEAAVLHVGEHEPLLVLTRINRDANGRAVEYSINRMVARLSGPIAYRMRTSTA
jgi:DNA-binding GntR family transcriptional regulator